MAGPDLSLITNAPNLTNTINQQQAISSQLAANQIDIKTKQNVYATQVLSAAAASGDQSSYDRGRQMLASQGIDVSNWAPDVASGQQQAYAAKLSQSPLGALLNSATQLTKVDQGQAALSGNLADATAGPGPQMLQRLIGIPAGAAPSLNAPVAAANSPAPSAAAPSAVAATIPAFQGLSTTGSANPPSLNAPVSSAAPSPQSTLPPPPDMSDPKYSRMTAAMKAEAFKADAETYNNRPDVIAGKEQAKNQGGASGTELGEAKKTYDVATAGLPFAIQRFADMRNAAQNASSGLGVDQAGDGWAQQFQNTSLGKSMSPEVGSGNQLLKQYASQGVLGELGPQLAQAGIRGNKFLESIAANASGIDMSAAPDDKVNLINGLQTKYIQNLKTEASVLRSNGQPAMSDAQIDQLAASAQKSPMKSTIPAPAIQQLKANPQTRGQFDQIFGTGAASMVLGQ